HSLPRATCRLARSGSCFSGLVYMKRNYGNNAACDKFFSDASPEEFAEKALFAHRQSHNVASNRLCESFYPLADVVVPEYPAGNVGIGDVLPDKVFEVSYDRKLCRPALMFFRDVNDIDRGTEDFRELRKFRQCLNIAALVIGCIDYLPVWREDSIFRDCQYRTRHAFHYICGMASVEKFIYSCGPMRPHNNEVGVHQVCQVVNFCRDFSHPYFALISE